MKTGTIVAGLLAIALVACGDETPPPRISKAAPPPAPAAEPAPEAKAPPAPSPVEPARPSADQALADRVKAALRAEHSLNADGIDIAAKDGAVTLFGTAESKMKSEIAAKVAASVSGVKSVENKLAVVTGS